MTREQLAHVLRAAAQIADDADIVVIGSQAILGTYSESVLPAEAVLSMEADIAFRDDRDAVKADQVEGVIGEDSQFHEEYAYYAQGVTVTTAMLPNGWRDRVIAYDRADAAPSRAVCVDAHDLVISKLYAGREKDLTFATALIGAGLIDAATLNERADLLDQPGVVITRVRQTIERCARRSSV